MARNPGIRGFDHPRGRCADIQETCYTLKAHGAVSFTEEN
jgi:hypothetical protein